MPMSGSILQLHARQVDLSGGVRTNIIPYISDTYDLGSPEYLWRTGHLSELYSLLFIENTIVLLGSRFVVGKGQGSLPYAVSASATQIDFGIPMTPNDFVQLRVPLQMEAIKVGTLASGSTNYNVTRNQDGSGANSWPIGSVFLILGNTGDGRIELNSETSPKIQIMSQGNTWNGGSELVRIGDLDGNWGYSGSTFGAAFGEYATNKGNITIDPTNGLRLRTYNSTIIQLDNSGSAMISGKLTMPGVNSAIAIGVTPPSGSANGTGLYIDRTGLYGVKSSIAQAYINGSGILYAGNGAVQLDENGVTIQASDVYGGNSSIKFSGSAGQSISNFYAMDKTTNRQQYLHMLDDVVDTTFYFINQAGVGKEATTQISAKGGDSTGTFILIRDDYEASGSAGCLISLGSYGGVTIGDGGLGVGLNIPQQPQGNVAYSGSLISYKNSTSHNGYIFVSTGSLTSTSFDGDSFSTTAKTLMDLSALYGLPANIKAVLAYVAVQDSGADSTECYVFLSPNNTSLTGMGISCFPASDRYNRQTVIVPCNADGDIYYQVLASGASTLDLFIRIWGYWI